MPTTLQTTLRSSYNTDTMDTESLRDSMATMMNSLVDTDKTGDTIGNEEMGEDFVYSSLVYDQLKKTDTTLANRFVKRVKKIYDNIYSSDTRETTPLFKAVNQALDKMVNAGNLAKNVCKTIKNVAFGKSQLDSKEGKLKRKATVIDNDASKNNVEEVLEKIGTNSIATTKQVQKVVDRNEGKVETKKTYNVKKHYLDGLKTDAVETTSVTPTTPVEETPAEETVTSDFIGGTNDMVFRPETPSGKVAVILPDIYSRGEEEISYVSLLDEDGVTISDMTYGGVDPDGATNHERKIFYYDDTQNLPSNVTVKFQKKSGDYFWLIFRNNEDQTVKYRGIDDSMRV